LLWGSGYFGFGWVRVRVRVRGTGYGVYRAWWIGYRVKAIG
jgi:hypothetical protein